MKNTPAVPVVATIFALPGAAVARPVQRVVYSVADTSIVPVAVCWRTEALSLSRWRRALHPQGDSSSMLWTGRESSVVILKPLQADSAHNRAAGVSTSLILKSPSKGSCAASGKWQRARPAQKQAPGTSRAFGRGRPLSQPIAQASSEAHRDMQQSTPV